MLKFLSGLAACSLIAGSMYAQSVISAHSGVIQYIEGRVLLGDKPLEMKASQFPDLKENAVLKTEDGRAEVLLTPGVFLRVGENSSIRMLSNHLSDTKIEVLSGESIIECDQLLKDNAITMVYKDASVAIAKQGLYRFDGSPARVRVYEGEAAVTGPSGQLTLKKGKETTLDGALMAVKFDAKAGDELMRWASRRSGYVAMANVAAARSVGSSYGYTSIGSGFGGVDSSGMLGSGLGMWSFNPWFGMFTFIPSSGVAWSPFGSPFWSPYMVGYAPFYGGYGYGYGYGYYGGGGGGRSTVTTAAFSGAPRWNTARTAAANGGGSFSAGRARGTPGLASGLGNGPSFSGRGGYSGNAGSVAPMSSGVSSAGSMGSSAPAASSAGGGAHGGSHR